VAALESLLGRALDPEAVRPGFASVTSPGRLEVVQRRPTVVLDGAHNPDAAGALASAVPESFSWNRLHLVVGMFTDKDVESVLRLLAPLADLAYVCMNSSPRSAPVARLEAALADAGLTDVRTFETVAAAVAASTAAAEDDDLILVTGSFYTVADARPLFVEA
jgi:dihydrofolate synthase/folylpolyglutamate synthase